MCKNFGKQAQTSNKLYTVLVVVFISRNLNYIHQDI